MLKELSLDEIEAAVGGACCCCCNGGGQRRRRSSRRQYVQPQVQPQRSYARSQLDGFMARYSGEGATTYRATVEIGEVREIRPGGEY